MNDTTPPPLKKIQFSKSAHEISHLPPDLGVEVAFAGRSNAGKSSAINSITGVKNLAKTSKIPGRTQLINFFEVEKNNYLVDLPGYGYAKVSDKLKQHWHKTMNTYFESRQSLQGLFLMMDIRHPLKAMDRQLLDWAVFHKIPTHILLTKADKLKRHRQHTTVMSLKKELSGHEDYVTMQAFSSLSGLGIEEAQLRLMDWLEVNELVDTA